MKILLSIYSIARFWHKNKNGKNEPEVECRAKSGYASVQPADCMFSDKQFVTWFDFWLFYIALLFHHVQLFYKYWLGTAINKKERIYM